MHLLLYPIAEPEIVTFTVNSRIGLAERQGLLAGRDQPSGQSHAFSIWVISIHS